MTETTDTSGMLALLLKSVADGHLEIVGTDDTTGEPTFRLSDAGRAYVESMFGRIPQHSVDISALTDDQPDEPSTAYQYAVFNTTLNEPKAIYGDQRWVASGQCVRDGSWPDGVIRRRRITFDYGEWETVP